MVIVADGRVALPLTVCVEVSVRVDVPVTVGNDNVTDVVSDTVGRVNVSVAVEVIDGSVNVSVIVAVSDSVSDTVCVRVSVAVGNVKVSVPPRPYGSQRVHVR